MQRRPAPVAEIVRRARKVPGPRSMTVRYGEFDYPGGDDGIAGGYTNPDTGEIFLRERSKRPRKDFALAHEAFHLLDHQVLTDRDRGRFQKILGFKGPWDQGTGTAGGGLKSPSELVADYYAAVAIGLDPRRQMVSSYADSFSRKKMRRFANSLDRLARRNGLDEYRP